MSGWDSFEYGDYETAVRRYEESAANARLLATRYEPADCGPDHEVYRPNKALRGVCQGCGLHSISVRNGVCTSIACREAVAA